ncbi:MAG: 4-hydroxyphenylacetate 3-hydroxylase C-terminal domain-containing protein, partial [Pseudomonadota bacterium]|nr:4-hydroxyphenylacetate 3-hydroxylase C-terminal domain-containing protein [Pseudomonadota bacterium]
QMLGTGTILSDYLGLSQITPIQPGDESHAINIAVACNAPGLKIYSRRSYASAANSLFDYPLSTRFDETDSFVVFDNVFIPWEQVFVYKNLDICRDQWWLTPSHSMGNHQSQIRFATKLRLLMGLGQRISDMNGVSNIPSVQMLLGEMGSYAAMMEGLVDAQIATCDEVNGGYVEPGRQALYAAIVLQSEVYPKLLNSLRELCGGGLIQLPSSILDFSNPESRKDIERYICSPGYPADERVKLMKLTWDLIGSEFAGRQEQYEKFYAGPPFVTKTRMNMQYDFEKSSKLVDAALAGYGLET